MERGAAESNAIEAGALATGDFYACHYIRLSLCFDRVFSK